MALQQQRLKRRSPQLLLAAVLAAPQGAPWLSLRWPQAGFRTATPAPEPPVAQDWFYIDQSTATFGALSELNIKLHGPAELARSYLLGDKTESDSVERLLLAARPLGAEIRRKPGGDAARSPVQRYSLSLPTISLLGLGTAEASMNVWGAIRSEGGPQAGGGPFMEIGSDGGPRVAVKVVGASEASRSRVRLDMRGALGLDEKQEGGPRIVGWIRLEVRGQVPSLGGVSAPEALLRPAARETLRRTLGFTTRRLGRDLAHDFVKWIGDRS